MGQMSAVALWSLSLVATPVGSFVPSAAVVRAADDEPQRRSRDDEVRSVGLQMGPGPTALAMVALLAAIVGRSLRRRRPIS